jgi:hypothetical protein
MGTSSRPKRSFKGLAGVAHDIAHHAQSSLSYLYPHLGRACAEAGLVTVRVELLDSMPYPVNLQPNQPLATALRGLRDRLVQILALHGYDIEDLTAVDLTFSFPAMPRDHSLFSVRARLIASTGRCYEHTVGMSA